jgi:hypothetical protein
MGEMAASMSVVCRSVTGTAQLVGIIAKSSACTWTATHQPAPAVEPVKAEVLVNVILRGLCLLHPKAESTQKSYISVLEERRQPT